jgi:hypothetical protein
MRSHYTYHLPTITQETGNHRIQDFFAQSHNTFESRIVWIRFIQLKHKQSNKSRWFVIHKFLQLHHLTAKLLQEHFKIVNKVIK